MNTKSGEKFFPIYGMVSVYIILVIAISLLPGKIPYEMVRENGPIEILSALGYFLFCLFLVYFNRIQVIQTSMAPAVFMLLLGLRELDFHARFTTMGMFKSRFFISPEVPVIEKLLVTLFIILLLFYIYSFLRKNYHFFTRELKERRGWAVSTICGVICVIFSKALDGNSDFFEYIFPFGSDPETFPRTMEECLELFIPIFFVRALIQYSWDSVKGRLGI